MADGWISTLWEKVVEFIVFGAISYLVVYQALLKQLGTKLADLAIIKQHTERIEEVKKGFNESLEGLKSRLSRSNIAHQVNLAEYTRRRFDRLECVHKELILLNQYVRDNLFHYEDRADFEKKIDEFDEVYKRADLAARLCALYIDQSTWNQIILALNNCYKAHMEFRGLNSSDFSKLQALPRLSFPQDELLQRLQQANQTHLLRLHELIKEFPELIKSVMDEARKPVVEIAPWIHPSS